MKFYISFDNWSHNECERSENILVEAESMDKLKEAINKIKAKYGKDFFYDFANAYQESKITEKILQALCDTNYSYKEFWLSLMENNTDWDEDWIKESEIQTFKDFVEFIKWDNKTHTNLPSETITSMFIHLLNAFGANIKVC